MKKIVAALMALTLFVAACGSSASKDKDSSKDSGKSSVLMITDVGGIDDKSFNQGTYEGLERLNKEDDSINVDYITSKTAADYETNLTNATEENPNLVIGVGFLFADAIEMVAKANPKQQYLLIDSVVDLPNVTSAVFAEHEGSYLVGIAAGMQAKADGKTKVGFIGGIEGELIKKFEAGYAAGVKSVYPEATVVIEYAGAFDDAAKGKTIASKMYSDGVYIIYHAAGATGNGLFAEAKDRRTSGEQVWAIGVDRDQFEDGKLAGKDESVVLTSMIKKVDVPAYEVGKQAAKGKLKGGSVLEFNVKNGGVGVPEENPYLSDEIIKAIDKAKEDIIAGTVKVPQK